MTAPHDSPADVGAGVIPLEILSDPICPWCLIGKRRLDRALGERPDHPFTIYWRPFQLNPDMPAEGMAREAYLNAKFGGPEQVRRVYGAIEETARGDGLNVAFDRINRTPNTLNAHRLIRWAGAAHGQDRVVEALFQAYFFDGEDIGDPEILARIGEAGGLEPAVTRKMLASDIDLETVRGEDAAAREAGVTGVPTFIVNGRFVVAGAQESALWVRVIDELWESLRGQSSGAASKEDGSDQDGGPRAAS